MNRKGRRFMIMRTSIVSLLMVSVSVAGATTTPMVTLQGTNNKVNALLKIAAAPGTPADQDRKTKIKAMAAGLFDYKELVKRAMAEHWTTITPAQQTDLVDTLKELIERKYVQQLKSNVDYKVKYGAEKVTGGDASVMTTIKVNTKGKSTDAEVEYKMHDQGGQW